MSLGEIVVVLLVALLVVKPEDISTIIKKNQEIKSYFGSLKSQAMFYLISGANSNFDDEDIEQLNFYLQKIIGINGYYNEGYTLQELKHNYSQLIKLNINHLKSLD
jgi:hypothetical protein